ncbi:MAG: ABC transporter substrate-binding protein [Roseitalea porphyridii]|uniref:ABC transporter substrate-binding protein n=1 Tax=Roseitalea porphyridii TaxID=1852022 RepID=UPI0032D90B5C
MTRLSLLAATATLALSVGTLPAKADCGEVSITQMDWASAAIVTAVSSFLMENGYGCDVTTVPSSAIPALASVAENGNPDIVTELWTNAAPAYARLRDEGKVVELNKVLSDGGVEGWWVPDYVAEEHPEAATLEGILENPDLVGNRFHNCPDNWTCRTINDNLNRAVDMEDAGIEIFNHGSGETLAASIASAYTDREPWFGYYWAPTAVLGKYPMVLVETAPHDPDIHDCNASGEDCAEPGLSAYPRADVVTAVTTDFAEREPEIAELMSNVAFTNDQMNALLAWQDENNASPEEAAVHFLQSSPDIWSGWLNEEARERLGALLQ